MYIAQSMAAQTTSSPFRTIMHADLSKVLRPHFFLSLYIGKRAFADNKRTSYSWKVIVVLFSVNFCLAKVVCRSTDLYGENDSKF